MFRKSIRWVDAWNVLKVTAFVVYSCAIVMILYDIGSFTLLLDPPDTDKFYDIDDINKTILREMADHYDTQMEQYHMSTNISVDVTYTNYNYNEIKTHEGTDNGNLHLGYTLAANCHRLQWALDNDDDVLVENASRMIKKCVSGFSDFMALHESPSMSS